MPEPTKKSGFIENMITTLTGKDRVGTITEGHCMTCRNEFVSENFRDEISEKEYRISGMCQECQDSFWVPDP